MAPEAGASPSGGKGAGRRSGTETESGSRHRKCPGVGLPSQVLVWVLTLVT